MRFRRDDLQRLSFDHSESRTQDFMTLRHLTQTLFERADVQRCAADTHSRKKIVERAVLFKLIEKPQTLLSKRERHQIPVALRSLYAWRHLDPGPQRLSDRLRQLLHRRLLEQTPQRDLDPKRFPHPRHHLCRQQRMAT